MSKREYQHGRIQVRNRLRGSEPVIGATLRLTGQGLPQPITGATNNHGSATLPTAGLADGGYVLSITPLNTDAGPVGPSTGSAAATDRIFRALSIDITMAGGVTPSPGWHRARQPTARSH